MKPHAITARQPTPVTAAPPSADDAQARAIARAVWTEIHWLMPRGRTVTVTVDGDDIAVEFGPAGQLTSH